MINEPGSNIVRTALTRLPSADAALIELTRFCNENSPVGEFQDRWGPEYFQRARELWSRSTRAFKTGSLIGASPDELLLCMAYDTAVAPYIGVTQAISHKFLHAVLRELRDSLK